MAEEFGYHDAPLINHIGWGLAAGALFSGGTDEQRHRFLPSIASMETFWVEGLSEPDAGSDLASLTTRAVRDGDSWVINGQKTYTTWGTHGDVMFLAARTDPESRRHQGLSIFCVDLSARGVTFAPMENIGGGRQNHTFLDDVHVGADMLIGGQGHGWELVMNAFYGAGGSQAPYAAHQRRLAELVEYCKTTSAGDRTLIDQSLICDKLGELALLVEAERVLTYVAVGAAETNERPPFAGALNEVVSKEAEPKFAEVYNEILGSLGQLSTGAPWAPIGGMPEAWYRWSFANHAGGTPQVKRMVLATRGLGLPR
jgi:alkylation response protein AidB-like acyl-CoA dehydrogenase